MIEYSILGSADVLPIRNKVIAKIIKRNPMNPTHGMLRVRTGHEHSRVTFVELFFDLIFVFAVTRLSHSLMEHFTLAYAGGMLVLLWAVWCVWIYTTWATNWLDPQNIPVRIMLFVLMLVGLLFSASIP